MLGIPIEQFIPVANFMGLALLGLLALIGLKWGKNQPTPGEKTLEVAGALVDNTSVKLVANAIEALVVEHSSDRQCMRETREAILALARSFEKNTDEIKELRSEVRRHADVLAARR